MMNFDSETKTMLTVAGVTIALLWLFRQPKTVKSSVTEGDPYGAPATASGEDAERENAAIALDAMRRAMEAGESPEALNKLNRILCNEYNVRIYPQKDGSLMVANKKGDVIMQG
jgi:hypothetical protein